MRPGRWNSQCNTFRFGPRLGYRHSAKHQNETVSVPKFLLRCFKCLLQRVVAIASQCYCSKVSPDVPGEYLESFGVLRTRRMPPTVTVKEEEPPSGLFAL